MLAATIAGSIAFVAPASAQQPEAGDSLATVRVRVVHDGKPIEGALVRSGRNGRPTDASGVAMLRLLPGATTIVASRIGFAPDSATLLLRAAQDAAVTIELAEQDAELEPVVISATRAERRVEDTPIRVEVIDEEEIAEKVAMTPGDVSMLLNETSGLRVQLSSPSLGGAGVRIQGLRGRYTLLLSDGLPLHGAQAGSLGLLQIPPMDLARVEVIKGGASALYGSNALGGVVNFLSRRPGPEAAREVLVNQTSRGGTDGVVFLSSPIGASGWGTTLLAGAHRQRGNDLDGDGWVDMPGYRRGVVRPRLFHADGEGRSLFATAGFTAEEREGGTLAGRTTPDGASFAEGLRTRRADAGVVGRMLLGGRDLLAARASATDQRHVHRFGSVRERDAHQTAFGELSLALPRGRLTAVAGVAVQAERYRNSEVPSFAFDHRVPGSFAQVDVDVARWLVLSGSGRADWHTVYGTMLSPRASVLLRRGGEGVLAGWTTRVSAGAGSFAPTPFTEETEAVGLSRVEIPGALGRERGRGASLDVGGPLSLGDWSLELHGTVFASAVDRPVHAESSEAGMLRLLNAPVATETWGAEALARAGWEPFRITASYAWTRSSEWEPGTPAGRRSTPLVPRHTAGFVAAREIEGESRVGVELYYTGEQVLEDNPYRSRSQPYVVVGLLAERVVGTPLGPARVFVNGENLGDVRQTRVDPLVLPTPGPGGRRTTDVWSLVEGRTVNAGVRLSF